MLHLDLKKDNLFTDTEKKVNEYILENPQEVISSTLAELAKKTNSSTATILRICRKVNISGFSDFKVKIAQEINSFSLSNYRIELDYPVSKDIEDSEIPKQLLNLHYQALTDTYNDLDKEKLTFVAKMIDEADTIILVGSGESLIIGNDFRYKLLRIGKQTICEFMEGFQLTHAYRINNKKALAIVISQYGRSKSVLKTIRTLSAQGVQSVLVTTEVSNPMIPYSTMAIVIKNAETLNKMGSFASRTSILFALDCIYSYYFKLNYDQNVETLNNYIGLREDVE